MNFFYPKELKGVKLTCLILFALTLFTCNKEETYENLPAYGPEQLFYALGNHNVITTYNAKDVRNGSANITISGLAATETLLNIDFRPATGELYGLSSLSKLYVIDIASGAARAISATAFTPLLNGTTVSMDFNAVDDRIRVVTNSGQNLRINPETGNVDGTDANLTANNISGIAYNNNFAGAVTSVLYELDAPAKKLYKQEPQNSGTLISVGNLGLSLGSQTSLDISPDNKNILAVGKTDEGMRLFTIDLANGKATLAGKFVPGTEIRGIAIPTNPVAYAVDNANNLLIFDPVASTSTLYSKPIIGLQPAETIYGIDMRPLNGQIYVLGSSSRLYTINPATAALTLVGNFSTSLVGSSFGFDFNPLTDMIKVVSNTGQNLGISPTTAAVIVEPSITPTTATLGAAAFSNNFRSASTTVLYVVDYTNDKIYTQNLNTGVLTVVGDLKKDVTAASGFDILYNSGDIAFGIFTVGTKTNVYTINLSTGEAVARYEFPKAVTGFTLGLRFN